MLSFAGGALGLVAGYVGMRALLTVNTAGLPRLGQAGSLLGMDWNIVLFTVVLSIVTGILFGLDPGARRVARRLECRHQGLEQPFGQRLPAKQDALRARARRGQPRRRAARRRLAADPHVARAQHGRSRLHDRERARPADVAGGTAVPDVRGRRSDGAPGARARPANSGRRRRVDDVLRAAAGRLRIAVQHHRPHERRPVHGRRRYSRGRSGLLRYVRDPGHPGPRVQRDATRPRLRPS